MFLDLENVMGLTKLINNYDGTIIAVSHDRYFVNRLATRFIDLGDNGRDFSGTYTEYYEWKESRGKAPIGETEQKEESTAKDDYLERKRANADRRKFEKHKADVAREIEALEREIADIDDLLFGEAATDYIRAAELSDRKTIAEDRLMQLYEEEETF